MDAINYNKLNRQYLYVAGVDKPVNQTNYSPSDQEVKDVSDITEANLISSRCIGSGDVVLHAPVIDFDLPIEVYPSSQLGHNHLYINKKMAWADYAKLLEALKNVGLIEEGFYTSALSHGYTAVRPPGVLKPDVPLGAEVLKENALMRREIYAMREVIDKLTGIVIDLKTQLSHEENDLVGT